MKAPQCAGIIHTDFERGFIRAETVAYDALVEAGSMAAAKEAGKSVLKEKNILLKMAMLCCSDLTCNTKNAHTRMY